LGVFVTIFLLFGIAYLVLFIAYRKGFLLLKEEKTDANKSLSAKVSIIVPARNEEQYLDNTIQQLLSQSYDGFFEIIVIDDHSTDATPTILQKYASRISIISLANHMDGPIKAYKKKAIEFAITQAKGDLIITTDADTSRGKYWLQSIVQYYQKNNYKIIAAPVSYQNTFSVQSIFETIDFLTMQGITAASLYYHFNSTCNGANLAYSKSAFLAVNGFEGIDQTASGDDMMLMYKIEKKFPNASSYLKNKDAIVTTYPTKNWKAFLQQRIRWASKSKFYADKRVQAVLLAVYGVNVFFLISCILLLFGKIKFFWLLVLLGLKIGTEILLVFPTLQFFQKKSLVIWHTVLQPLHIAYIIISGFLGLVGKYDWKGRQLS
jgi:cellulose synthase/poly-beta-1,6-N-acetylglucosamine synthase-like glycosyltransferase